MTNRIEHCGDGGGGVNAAFSQSDGSLLVKETEQPRFGDVLEVFDIPVNLVADTYLYPGDAGFSDFGFQQSISFFFKVTTNADTTVRLQIMCSNHHSLDDFVNNTECWVTTDNNSVTEIVIPPSSTDYLIGISKINPEFDRYGLQIVVETTGTSVNTIYAAMLRRAK